MAKPSWGKRPNKDEQLGRWIATGTDRLAKVARAGFMQGTFYEIPLAEAVPFLARLLRIPVPLARQILQDTRRGQEARRTKY